MERCTDCGFEAKSARGLATHRRAKHPADAERILGPVERATQSAVDAADHLGPTDAGTVAVLLDLARTIDRSAARPAGDPFDNVTKPTYLKYATELGLTALSRGKLPKKEQSRGSKLAELRSIQGGRGA